MAIKPKKQPPLNSIRPQLKPGVGPPKLESELKPKTPKKEVQTIKIVQAPVEVIKYKQRAWSSTIEKDGSTIPVIVAADTHEEALETALSQGVVLGKEILDWVHRNKTL